jgi:hypothetical protein
MGQNSMENPEPSLDGLVRTVFECDPHESSVADHGVCGILFPAGIDAQDRDFHHFGGVGLHILQKGGLSLPRGVSESERVAELLKPRLDLRKEGLQNAFGSVARGGRVDVLREGFCCGVLDILLLGL